MKYIHDLFKVTIQKLDRNNGLIFYIDIGIILHEQATPLIHLVKVRIK